MIDLMESCMSWIVLEASWDVRLMARPTSMFVPFSGSKKKSEISFLSLQSMIF